MAVNSRTELVNYALRKLGAPVLKIEIAPEQIEDRVDEALQFFQDYHYDATERIYLKHQIKGSEILVTSPLNFIVGEMVRSSSGATFQIESINSTTNRLTTKIVYKNGLTNGTFTTLEGIQGLSSGAATTVISKITGDIENGFVPISDMVTGVIRALPWWGSTTSGDNAVFDPQYQAVIGTFQNLASSSLIHFEQLLNHISLLDQVLRPIDSLRFNRKTSQIHLDFDWSMAQIGGFLVFECYRILDPNTFGQIYNDRMLKKLVTAKLKYQWASNFQKYQGIQLLGGVTVDATTLMAQAVAEIEAAENEIQDAYSLPAIGFLG